MLTRYGHTAIIAMDAAALRRVRGKTRVLLTRFLARALLCPIFSQEWAERPQKGGIIQLVLCKLNAGPVSGLTYLCRVRSNLAMHLACLFPLTSCH